MFFFFLTSGLFLGWSLGANDGANVFGTAVGSKMVKFRTAAIIAGISVILGAWLSGRGASRTLEQLGEMNEIAGAFIVALAAAATLYWMTRLELPVSATQSIVGAIIGWNLFSGSLTDMSTLRTIVGTWVICPVLAAGFSAVFYLVIRAFLQKCKIHLINLDFYNRAGLILVGAFGAYSLGANNIANVVGVFVPVSPFTPLDFGIIQISEIEQLFILGGISIAVGIYTYSQRVMTTVGKGIVKLNPVSALTIVLSASLVLFLFASQDLKSWLISYGLPSLPLVPVSSSQAIVGAILGIGLVHGGRGINYKMLAKVSSGWVVTPVIACVISLMSLFIMQNVFNQKVYQHTPYQISTDIVERLKIENISTKELNSMEGVTYKNAVAFRDALSKFSVPLSDKDMAIVMKFSRIYPLKVDIKAIDHEIKSHWFTMKQANALKLLNGKEFSHTWQLYDDLVESTSQWRYRKNIEVNKRYNKDMRDRLEYLYRKFKR